MKIAPVKTPIVVQRILPSLVWNISSEQKAIYLTFDDGPTEEITDWTLDVLKEYKAKATFFCVGKNVARHSEIYNRIQSDGHSIGNHTYSHLKGWTARTKEYLEDIAKASDLIDSKLFRPPYGQIRPKQAKAISKLGYRIIMWNVLSFDWDQNKSKEQCLENVINNTISGDIVVFHDSLKAAYNMQYALPEFLKHFTQLDFSFKSIEL